MDWKQVEDRLVAATDYGDYVIHMAKRPPEPQFEVTLHSNGNMEMKGEYESVARATEAAEEDHRHRDKMWALM